MNAASNQHLAIAGACTWKKCWVYEKIGNKSWNPSLFFVSQFFLSRFHPREITAKISFSYFSRHRTSDKRKPLPLHENPSHDRYFRIQSRISAENIVRDCFDVSFFFSYKKLPLPAWKPENLVGPFFDFHFCGKENGKKDVDLSAHNKSFINIFTASHWSLCISVQGTWERGNNKNVEIGQRLSFQLKVLEPI